jgi:sulfite reductase (ferredoxin)
MPETAAPSPPAVKLSPAEAIKQESQYLRGVIGTDLLADEDHVSHSSEILLKFHGTYQQDDRDVRGGAAEDGGKRKSYIFMVRSRVPGGRVTSDQMLAELDLCDEVGNATLRITSRQGFQLHGVLKQNLKQTIARINEIQLSTLAACGDVNRNVMCCPAPFKNAVYTELQRLTDALKDHFAPRTKAYHELWLTDTETGEKQLAGGASEDDEPIYGKHYLPRKFKMGVALPDDNCIDVQANDLGFLAKTENGQVVGYNVLVGGGMGVTPANKKTFPALAQYLCYTTPDQAVAVAEAVVKVQRDFGNREDRKQARLKYLVHNWGLAKFKEKVEEYYGGSLAAPDADTTVRGFDDHMGWAEQGDGLWFYGLNVENGRIKDTDEFQLKSAIREICHTLKPGIRLTAHQSMLFSDIRPEDKPVLEAILRKHHVKLTEEISKVRRWSMACVAWPTCGLSITESERALPGILDHMEGELAKLGLASDRFTVRMTGCPNGCARPYNCDIGLVGKARGKYTVFVGGRLLGDRLNFIYQDMVLEDDVVKVLVPVFTYYKHERLDGETLGDFCHRKGKDDLLAYAQGLAAQTA